MAHLKLLAPLLASLGTCAPQAQPPTAEQPPAPIETADAPAREPAARPLTRACDDAPCWRARADAAEQRGALDVAAALRGRAFTAAPNAASLDVWLAALSAADRPRGALAAVDAARALARARGDAVLTAAIDAAAARLPAAPAPAPLAASPDAAVQAAREAQARGRLDDALAAYTRASAPDAAALADAADLLALRGDARAAAHLRSRARAHLRDADLRLSLLPVETWHTQHATWLGDQLVLARYISGIDDVMLRLGALELWSLPPGPGGPARRHLLPRPVEALAADDDGRTIVRAEAGELVLQDMLLGTVTRRLRVAGGERDAAIGPLLAVGAGDDLRILVGVGAGVSLWSARGERLDRFALAGTTPTITRAYTGEGSYHHNILGDAATWPTALAMTPDAAIVAIGGSDSKVRVFDRKRKTSKVLSFPWEYTEHRHMGGNPDLNAPLALRLLDGGARLLAIHRHGERLVWDTRTGAVLTRDDGACTRAEAEALANRHATPGAPRVAVRDEDLKGCGRATLGAIAPDGGTIVTGGLGAARVRGGDGRPIAYLTGRDQPDQFYALSAGGALAMASLYGRVDTWRPGQLEATTQLPAEPSGPIDPQLSTQGRFLHFQVERPHAIVWDLFERRRLAPTAGAHEVLLGVSDDGRFAAVHLGADVELRDARTRAALARVPVQSPPFGTRAQFTALGVLLSADEDGRRLIQVALPAGHVHTLDLSDLPDLPDLPSGVRVSPDGRHLVLYGLDPAGGLIDLARRALVWPIDRHVRTVAFAADGSALAWLVHEDPRKPQFRAVYRRVDASAPPIALALSGWPSAVAVRGDGEVAILVEGGELHRWRPATGEHRVRQDLRLYAHGVQFIAGRAALLLLDYDHIRVVADDPAFTPLATLMPLLSGGWAATSASGAVDGSDDAPRHFVTRADGPAGALLLPGSLAWDGAAEPDVYPRALAGEDVQPPVP